MNRWAERLLFLGLGALITPTVELVAAKYAGRHWLEIHNQEKNR